MIKRESNTGGGEFLFNILLFCMFAFFALAVLLAGAKAYRTFAARIDDNFAVRTAAGYLTNKLHQNDAENSVSITEFGGVPAIALTQPGLEDYHTLIYCSGGALREIFAHVEFEMDPDSGMEIVESQGLEFEQRPGGVWVRVLDGAGDATEFFVAVRSDAA